MSFCLTNRPPHLTPELVGEVLQTIKGIAETGITMIVVTHEIAFAKEVASRVIYMQDGVIVEQGPPSEILVHQRIPAPSASSAGLPTQTRDPKHIDMKQDAPQPDMWSRQADSKGAVKT